jgi:hypothetical protein
MLLGDITTQYVVLKELLKCEQHHIVSTENYSTLGFDSECLIVRRIFETAKRFGICADRGGARGEIVMFKLVEE